MRLQILFQELTTIIYSEPLVLIRYSSDPTIANIIGANIPRVGNCSAGTCNKNDSPVVNDTSINIALEQLM